MRGRYKVYQGEARVTPGIVASLRVDCWNGKGLTAVEKRQVYQAVAAWVTREMAVAARKTKERVAADLAGTLS